MPIINSVAFLFTVLGEYLAEGKGVERGMLIYLCGGDVKFWDCGVVLIRRGGVDTWIGMGMVCAGIGLCVQSKLS